MDPAESPLRLRLILGKFRVKSVYSGALGIKAVIDFTNSVTMSIDIPVTADVRVNDLLTFYTEVPYAKSGEPPIQ